VSAQIEVRLDHRVVECGGTVAGTVRWTGNRRGEPIVATLRYGVSGRGDPDGAEVARVHVGLDEAGQAGLRLEVPTQGPVTYNGQLLRVRWQAMVFGRGGSRRKMNPSLVMVEVIVVPQGWMSVHH
jgi:hypothetical protein